DLLVFLHGDLGPCVECFEQDPESAKKFGLDSQIERSNRPVALAVPTLHWKGDDLGQIGGKWSAANFNTFVQEVLDAIGNQIKVSRGSEAAKPMPRTLRKLIIVGHSRAYNILTPLAREFNRGAPATTTSHLSKLAEVWALDSTYSETDVRALEVWASLKQ